jgi:hypothetical protein
MTIDGFGFVMDLLTTYIHDSELQAITAPPPISTIHKPFPACYVFTSHSLATVPNGGDLQLHELRYYLHSYPYRTQLTV